MMVGKLLGVMLWGAVWFVALPVLTFVFGVPASLYLMSRQSRGGFPAFVGWIVAAQAGWVPTFAGPFGLPTLVFWPLALLFGMWFAVGFTIMGRAAWSQAFMSNRLMRDYGMPPSEIV